MYTNTGELHPGIVHMLIVHTIIIVHEIVAGEVATYKNYVGRSTKVANSKHSGRSRSATVEATRSGKKNRCVSTL